MTSRSEDTPDRGIEDRVANLERAETRQNREARVTRGEAKPLPGAMKRPVGVPASYWSERQSSKLKEMVAVMPVIEAVAGLPVFPSLEEFAGLDEAARTKRHDELLNERFEHLMRAARVVNERLRKSL